MVRNEKNNTINWSAHETHDLARAFAFSHKQCVQVEDDSKQLRSGHARMSDYQRLFWICGKTKSRVCMPFSHDPDTLPLSR